MPRVDIHFHLLPGVDDGPATLEESVALARDAVRDGTATVVATPHVRHDQITDVTDLPDRVREVEDRLARESVPLEVHCGGELGHEMVARLGQSELETIAVGPPRRRWVLLETPFAGLGDDLHSAADELRRRGFGVVLAHPERTARVLEDGAAALRREFERGSRLQLNAWSLDGGHGSEAERAGFELLDAGLASVIASDAHSGWRGPALTRGFERIAASPAGAKLARRLTDSAPARLVARGVAAAAPVAA